MQPRERLGKKTHWQYYINDRVATRFRLYSSFEFINLGPSKLRQQCVKIFLTAVNRYIAGTIDISQVPSDCFWLTAVQTAFFMLAYLWKVLYIIRQTPSKVVTVEDHSNTSNISMVYMFVNYWTAGYIVSS